MSKRAFCDLCDGQISPSDDTKKIEVLEIEVLAEEPGVSRSRATYDDVCRDCMRSFKEWVHGRSVEGRKARIERLRAAEPEEVL